MKMLVIGADGFIGRNVVEALSPDHEVYRGTRQAVEGDDHSCTVDLLDRKSIADALQAIRPEVIINAAGIVDPGEKSAMNPTMSTNLLEEAAASGLDFKRIIISGSAGEYGLVDPGNIPVKEDAPLNANAGYGLSKLEETKQALEIAEKNGLPLTVARIFNPIGPGMHERFLIPKILQQIEDVKSGKKDSVEIGRYDSKRDYINVKDLANAIKVLAEGEPRYPIYNVGSGTATANGDLVRLIMDKMGVGTDIKIVELSPDPEPVVAIQADVTRLRELGWKPEHTIEDTVEEITDEARR